MIFWILWIQEDVDGLRPPPPPTVANAAKTESTPHDTQYCNNIRRSCITFILRFDCHRQARRRVGVKMVLPAEIVTAAETADLDAVRAWLDGKPDGGRACINEYDEYG